MPEYRQIRMEETLTKWYLHLTRNVEKNGYRAERNTEGSPDTSTPRVEGKFNMTDKHGEGRGAEKREGRRRERDGEGRGTAKNASVRTCRKGRIK
jgi:hypothetical protein